MPKCWSLTKGITHPVELLIPVVVLGGTQGVGDPLNAVDDWAGEIVDGVDSADGGREGVSKATERRRPASRANLLTAKLPIGAMVGRG